jgi:hypothetical protein
VREWPVTGVEESLAGKIAAVAFGSGHAGRLLKFVAEKPPLTLRFPEAAIRHGVHPTL